MWTKIGRLITYRIDIVMCYKHIRYYVDFSVYFVLVNFVTRRAKPFLVCTHCISFAWPLKGGGFLLILLVAVSQSKFLDKYPNFLPL